MGQRTKDEFREMFGRRSLEAMDSAMRSADRGDHEGAVEALRDSIRAAEIPVTGGAIKQTEEVTAGGLFLDTSKVN